MESNRMSNETSFQFIGAIKKTIFENETKADFEGKFVSQIKAATARMLVAKKIITEIRPELVKFHDKVHRLLFLCEAAKQRQGLCFCFSPSRLPCLQQTSIYSCRCSEQLDIVYPVSVRDLFREGYLRDPQYGIE